MSRFFEKTSTLVDRRTGRSYSLVVKIVTDRNAPARFYDARTHVRYDLIVRYL